MNSLIIPGAQNDKDFLLKTDFCRFPQRNKSSKLIKLTKLLAKLLLVKLLLSE